MAFRILNQRPVYFDLQGRPASGGRLDFFISGTDTPKNVFGEPALTTNNGSSVALNSAGRTVVDVWGDGVYRVRFYAADGTLVTEADNVEVGGGGGASIPTLVAGEFLSNNGAVLLWAPVLQLPDPTGQDGKYPVATGTGYVLQAPPAAPVIPEPDIEVATGTFRAADGTTSFFYQSGSATAAATGTVNTSSTVTFPTPFLSAPKVMVIPSSDSNVGGPMVAELTSAPSTTGFTVLWTIAAGSLSSAVVNNSVPFDWIAFGNITTPAA